MNTYVLDTNIISYYLKQDDKVVCNIKRSISQKDDIIIAPIAYYEIKRGLLI